ncbi:hypothetical protein ACFIJ5_15485 [Haloimpatiens sp. FM7330]|uniref:hypothetical protein n=1 Tax=Haloimpatiens sp. FM7330 TaxID=3298610 RepID=UPI00363D91B0
MLPNSPHFIFYVENIKDLDVKNSDLNNFIDKYSLENLYFFTHLCNMSRQTLLKKLHTKNILCNISNIMTPTYLLINYCKSLMEDFSVYPITDTDDFEDFHMSHVKINYTDPDIIFLCTKEINEQQLTFINNTTVPIAISSNLCHNRLVKCNKCFKNCKLREINLKHKHRIIMPDLPPSYNSSVLFKELNLHPKHTVMITTSLRDDYIQYKRMGCKIILLLRNEEDYKNYLNSPHDVDLVLNNFDNFFYFLKLKAE